MGRHNADHLRHNIHNEQPRHSNCWSTLFDTITVGYSGMEIIITTLFLIRYDVNPKQYQRPTSYETEVYRGVEDEPVERESKHRNQHHGVGNGVGVHPL